MIQFICPVCNKGYEYADSAAGQKIRCSGCNRKVRIPGGNAPSFAPRTRDRGSERSEEGGSYLANLGIGVYAIVVAVVLVGVFVLMFPMIRKAMQKQDSARNDPKNETGTGKDDITHLTAVEIAANYEKSVALISYSFESGNKRWSGWGSGFAIERDIVATNHHVIENAKIDELTVTFPSSNIDEARKPLKARLLYEDRKRDIAFLKVSTFDLPPLKLSTGKNTKGEDIFSIGSPGSGQGGVKSINQVNPGSLTNPNWYDDRQQLSFHIISASVNWGNSGGPVLDSKGEVIGIATQVSFDDNDRRLEGISKAIPTQPIQDALLTLRNKTFADIEQSESKHNTIASIIRSQKK